MMEGIVVGKAVPQPAITAINRLLHGQAGYAELRRVAQSAATPRVFSPLPTPRRRVAIGTWERTQLGRHPRFKPGPTRSHPRSLSKLTCLTRQAPDPGLRALGRRLKPA